MVLTAKVSNADGARSSRGVLQKFNKTLITARFALHFSEYNQVGFFYARCCDDCLGDSPPAYCEIMKKQGSSAFLGVETGKLAAFDTMLNVCAASQGTCAECTNTGSGKAYTRDDEEDGLEPQQYCEQRQGKCMKSDGTEQTACTDGECKKSTCTEGCSNGHHYSSSSQCTTDGGTWETYTWTDATWVTHDDATTRSTCEVRMDEKWSSS